MIIMQQNTRTFDTRQNFDFVNSFQNHQEASVQRDLYCKDQRQIQKHRLPQKCRKNWTRRQREQYAQTLQAYQDSQITKAESFYQHLSEILGRSPQQVRVYHHKMMSEYVYAHRVVTSILGKRATRNSRNSFKKIAFIEENAEHNYYEKENILAQNFSSNQQIAFTEQSVALTSLDQYEESSEEIQVFQLQQDDYFDENDQNIKNNQDWSTNGSEGRASSQQVQMVELLQE